MRFGILQRYVLGEIFRAFFLALLTITCVFVLLTVMTKAASAGLGPREIMRLVPYMIPTSFPYTIPVSLLFASTVVYGRLASDNEVIAVKTAGQSAMVLIWPVIGLALGLSLLLTWLTATAIPQSTAAARQVIFQDIEDMFYKKLKMEKVFNFSGWPFLIKVKDVEGRIMKGATFKQRAEKQVPTITMPGMAAATESGPAYQMIVQATEATIDFHFKEGKVEVFFKDADISRAGVEVSEGIVHETSFPFDIPNKDGGLGGGDKMFEEMTVAEMRAKEAEYRDKILLERKHQAIAAAWFIASGRLAKVTWKEIQGAFSRYDYYGIQITKIETEVQMRQAMAWGSLFFVVLGAPVGIIFARRDFLSAFISCFMPIIILYYPLMLVGTNLAKEGTVHPLIVWSGNIVLWGAAWFWALPPVLRR